MGGRGSEEVWDGHMHTYLKWITNKELLYSTENVAQCYVAVWMGGENGGEEIRVYVWQSPLSPETFTTLLLSSTPVQNEKCCCCCCIITVFNNSNIKTVTWLEPFCKMITFMFLRSTHSAI